MLVERFNSVIPSDIKTLMELPGVGQKTANVVASIIYNVPAIAVDTHVFRVSHRLGMAKGAEKIIYASREFDVGMIVIGLPKNMDGTEGGRAEKTRKLAKLVELGVQVPIVFWDERRTTVTAAAQLTDAGTFGKKRKGKLDAVSAAVILDSFLAWRKNHPGEQPT